MGGIVSKITGGDKAAKAQEKAAEQAAKQFRPYNISSPSGQTKRKDRDITVSLSKPFQGLLTQFQDESAGSIDARAADLYGRMQALAQVDEDRARMDTESRLFQSGRLGTYGGMRVVGEVERALADSRLQRELSAFEMANNFRNSAFGNALALAQLPNSLVGMGINRNPGAAVAASGYLNAGNTLAANEQAGLNALLGPSFNAAGNALGSFATDSLSSLFSNAANTAAFAGAGYAGAALPAASFGGTALTGAQVATAFSDRRLKRNIKPAHHDGRLQWYTFEYKNPAFGSGVRLGVMADEVERVIPEAVSVAANGYKQVDYGRIR